MGDVSVGGGGVRVDTGTGSSGVSIPPRVVGEIKRYLGRFRSRARRAVAGGRAPSLADALGVVEADARGLGPRGNDTVGGKVVREAAAVAAVASAPGEIEAYVGQLRVQADGLFRSLGRRDERRLLLPGLLLGLRVLHLCLPSTRRARGPAGGERVSARSRRNAGGRGGGAGSGARNKQRPAPAPAFTLTRHRLRSDPEPGRERLAP